MRMLVTGGLGFIGSNFINYWLSHHPKDSIINIDKETYASNRNNIDYSLAADNYEFVKGDICDSKLVDSLVSRVDTVVNFAAESHVDNSISKPEPFLHSNYLGVFSLLEAVRKYDVRFHQVSTDEVYGSLPLGSEEKFSENSPYNPRNPYSATKAAADHLVLSYVNTYGVNATISNCSNNFGPNQHPEKLIPKVILNALAGRKIPIYGDGGNIRDWIYVEDHCKGIELILEKGRKGDTYLLSAENELSNKSLVKIILDLLGMNESLMEYVEDRPGHDSRYAIDPAKAESDLGWKSSIDFNEAIRKTIDFYKLLRSLPDGVR